MIFQDGSNNEQANDDDNDQDEFLNDALNETEQHVDLININSLHLN